jgi:hypothetical protein
MVLISEFYIKIAGLTLIAVSSLFEKAEGAGMEIISFLSTR